MDSKLWKFAATAALASSVIFTNPAFAQSQQSDSASSGQSSPSQSEQRADDGNKDWGWLGLLGLIGLAGLRRRRDRDLPRDTTATNRGPGVYNR
jgi:MYXO-CTERM domain-containing protein